MSQLRVEAGVDVAKAWVVVVDLEALSAEVTLLLVVAGAVEGAADTAVRVARDGEDGPALLAQLLEGLGPAGVSLFEEELRGALVGGGSVPVPVPAPAASPAGAGDGTDAAAAPPPPST